MSNFNSSFLKTLQSRNYIQQITHSLELDQALNKATISAYIGFDCTAQSLHIGSLIQIMILRQLQKSGHQPIVLLGGGTTKIGDPSGKDEARKFLDDTKINDNLTSIQKTLEKFDLSKKDKSLKPFVFVNNTSWLENLKYIDFLREFGRHFSVNRMLSFDSVKLRLDREQPLSFLEFNYMILQAYDFYKLNLEENCTLQIGGSDQWGNIVNGVELVRRIAATDSKVKEVYGLTTPLLTTSDGKKMGKTANGAVWLSAEMLSVFDYFQFFRNIDDADTSRFFRFFTELSENEILEEEKKDINQQKQTLAYEATKICHGEEQAQSALEQAKRIFSGNKGADINALEELELPLDESQKQEGVLLFVVLRLLALCSSGGEAKKLIRNGGVKINDQKITDESYKIDIKDAKKSDGDNYFKLSIGKKRFFKVKIDVKI